MSRPDVTLSVTRDDAIGTISMDDEPRIVLDTPPVVAGYDILRVIGQGGMGIVWEALEHRFDRHVALKVHKYVESASEARALWAEAYVAAKIGDPGVVRVHDVGLTLDEKPYYTMDYVDGTELAALIAEGPIPARRAVEIAIDITRAAAAAHDHGIIHCDLKSRNVLLDSSGRARILDFGIAHNARGPAAHAYKIAGTPAYMAPEQAAGGTVGPATDIYAIGVLLYEMLSNRRPFVSEDQDALLELVKTAPIPPLREVAPGVSHELASVVEQCLEKLPENRVPNGRMLLDVLNAIRDGRALPDAAPTSRSTYAPRAPSSRPPADKPRRDEATKHFVWSWKLKSTPEQLWPWVANTDRFNRSIGQSAVDFTDEITPDGTSERNGKMRTLGMNIQWREYPFEWIKEREHAVFRLYKAGPIRALWNRVQLAPLPEGGTELTHEMWVLPRGVFGSLATFVEIGQKVRKQADKSYRRMDAMISSASDEDPFEPPYVPTPGQFSIAQEGFQKLVESGFPKVVVDRLAHQLLAAPDQVAAVMRPYALADSWGADRGEVLDLFLHAAHLGLTEIAWDMICPRCMMAHETVPELARVTRIGTCEACVNTFERDLSRSVELVFRPDPTLRSTGRSKFCAGAPALRPHVFVQQMLEPGESRVVTVKLPHGTYQLAAAFMKGDTELASSAVGYESNCAVSVRGDGITAHPSTVLAGDVTLHLTNETDQEQTVRLEVQGARKDIVAAASAVTHPTFRELFANDLLARGERLNVGRMSFVFVQAEERTRVFAELGDNRACELFESLDQIVREEMMKHEGSDVPAALGLFVCAFPHAPLAASAALAIARTSRERVPTLGVRLSVHEGSCLALTRSERLEYFGETLDRGIGLLADAPRNGIAFSSGITADHRVSARLHQSGVTSQVVVSSAGPYAGRRVTTVMMDTASIARQRTTDAPPSRLRSDDSR